MDEEFFVLENEISDDVNVFSTVGLDLGLTQGSLSDEEIAIKVVEEFLHAWLEQDYARAIQIYGYRNSQQKKWAEQRVREYSLNQIIAVEPPILPEPPKRGLLVSSTVEISDGNSRESKMLTFYVREFEPGRWRIINVKES